ncbi:unnamed protein product [Phytophthora fragariaefolia]|uniref:Unnamed protein product n=1 Tax=Phytophthora fragariaefolia TaxID=1490495 RepID=A0A9W6YNZ0_9STRA|nr:unnamed protein product [Phytophthora fragariaefolia]
MAEPPPSPPVLHARLSATTSGGDSRLIVLSLHVEGAQRPICALLDSGATNNFVRAASLPALPADMSIRESGGEMIVNYADGKPRRTPRRSATFAYGFDGFRSSEEFLVIELSGSFDCVFGIPWVARHQPAIYWLAVMDPDSMTHAAPEESDGPSCAVCEYATCAGPEQESQDASDVVEHGFPPGQLALRLGADVGLRHPESADVIEHGFSLSAVEETPRTVRRRGRRKPRRPRAPSQDPVETESEVILVLVENNADEPPRVCNVEVARPPCDAAEITRLPSLSWKHFLRDLRRGEIEQVCMIVAEDAASIAAVETHASDSTSDARTRPKGAEPKTARAARCAAQSLPALEAAGNPVAPLVREFSDIFPDKVPAALPPDRGVRHAIDLVPGANRAAGGMTDVEMHLQHLRQVFEVMRENKLYAIPKKCIFCAPEIPVLGSYVSTEGVRADPEKIETICAWPVPQDQKQLRQWLGLATYLQHYSKNFAATIRPLSQLLKADAAWSWCPGHQTAFDAVKTSFPTAPVLMLPDHSKAFHVVCDANDFAIGCALMQFDDEGRERVVSYQSRQLKPAERNYPVHDKELLAMRYAPIKFRVYLLGEQTFAVYTDHASLRTAQRALTCPSAWHDGSPSSPITISPCITIRARRTFSPTLSRVGQTTCSRFATQLVTRTTMSVLCASLKRSLQ